MPIGKTYVKVARTTLGSNNQTVTFSNIPQNFTDLILVVAGTFTTGATNNTAIQFNSDTGTNYGWTRMLGDGTSATSGHTSNDVRIDFGMLSSTNQSNSIAHIQNYSNGGVYKTVLGRGNSTEYVGAVVGTWRNIAAITSITVISSAIYASGTTFTIYGIAASKAPKAIGGTVTTDGSYWIHTYTSSGSFTPQESIDNLEYLVVAGGGSGGNYVGGGGGAGGLKTGTLSCYLSTAYTVTVGAGGAARANPDQNGQLAGNSGSNSVFSTVTSTGGGGGGAAYSSDGANGKSGGSGGGAGGQWSSGSAGGTGNSGEGSNGGSALTNSGGAGGGGAGAVGSAGTATNVGGNGGNGTTSSISGTSVTYAGGGGGSGNSTKGAGGTGGGGDGGTNNAANAVSGTTNRGGGGGGMYYNNSGTSGAGGSGIVIVRYPV